MTGRDIIIFILANHLEDVEFVNVHDKILDTEIMFDGKPTGLMTVEQAAVKWDTGVSTVKALFEMGKIRGWKIGGKITILDQPNPFQKG